MLKRQGSDLASGPPITQQTPEGSEGPREATEASPPFKLDARGITLDVVVPTYNRCLLLRNTIRSLFEAPIPDSLSVTLFIVDNASDDDTASVVRKLQSRAPFPMHYLSSPVQGSSASRNAGISAGNAELIGFVDDDEEVGEAWYRTIAAEFTNPQIQFIGGPCLPLWEAKPPNWLPPGYHSVIGVIPPKRRGAYGNGHPGMLNGGNAVLRRTVFEQVGMYSTRLGRTPKRLLSEEDAEFFRRLLAANLRGMYVPELVIYHYVPATRLTRRYHRRWAYWRGVSQGVLDREIREPVAYFFGVPRHRIGRAARGLAALPRDLLTQPGRGEVFADELACWDLFGFVHGKFFTNTKDQ